MFLNILNYSFLAIGQATGKPQGKLVQGTLRNTRMCWMSHQGNVNIVGTGCENADLLCVLLHRFQLIQKIVSFI